MQVGALQAEQLLKRCTHAAGLQAEGSQAPMETKPLPKLTIFQCRCFDVMMTHAIILLVPILWIQATAVAK
jgi:hypothetical protein